MQTFEIQVLEQEVRKKQESLAKMDEDILQELARQELLQELCESSVSATPRSGLSQSSISSNNQSNTSISSSFLQQEIDRVHEYYRKHQLPNQTGETHERTKEINNNNMQQFPLPYQQNNRTKIEHKDQYSSFFKQTAKHQDIDLQIMRKEYLKTISRIEQQEKDKQVRQFLEQKDRIRQNQLQQQRQKIRQQLIQQQQNNNKTKQSSNTTFKKQQSFIASNYPDNNCLKLQRTKALNHLLHQLQKGKQKTSELLTKTRTFSHY